MSVRFLSDVFKQARTLLNDDDAANWPDYRLHSKAIVAFEELEAELIVAGIPIIQAVTGVINIPATECSPNLPPNPSYTPNPNFPQNTPSLDLSTLIGYPDDMLLPIWMKERQLGQFNQDFVDMVEVDFLPNVDLDIYLHYWCWYQNTIMVLGVLNPVQIQIRYQRYLQVPKVNTDSLIVPLGQLYLANRVAALAYWSVGNMQASKDLSVTAEKNLGRILDMNIKELQDLPAKRRPYHRGYGRNRVLRDF